MADLKPRTQRDGGLSSGEEVPIFRTEENRARFMAMYDEGLGRWPVPYETFFLDTRYGRTHVIASGDAASPPLLLIDAMGVAGFSWASIAAPLSDIRRVYALDTIGDVGRSELADPGRYPRKGRDYSAWLEDVSEQLHLAAADLVAASMGGWIAMRHAISAPERVRRLVLLGPMGLPSWRTTVGVLAPMISSVIRPSEAKLERILTRALGDGERVNREFRPWMRQLTTCRQRLGLPLHLPNSKLRMIKAPTLLFMGGKDGLIGSPSAAAKRARATIAGCQIEILPHAGHGISVDEPKLVAQRIVNFLEAGKG
jgi:pimeloyl-ACP methyl ester carboxylesterase